MSVKKIILFGGTFDPIHNGHVEIAKKAFKKIKAEKLIFIPCKNHPQQKNISATDEQRMDMIRIAIKDINNFELSDYEIKKENISYSFETIKYFKDLYNEYEIYFLIGYDQLANFKTWKNWEEILKDAKLIAHKREIENNLQIDESIECIKIGNTNINARSSLLKLEPDKKYLNHNVIRYINENGIYAIDRLKQVMSEYRLQHSIRVANLAVTFAEKLKLYNLVSKAYVAAIYHDYAKELDDNTQIKIAKKLKIKNYPSVKVLHGPVGAHLVEKKFYMDDYQIISAIKNHVIPQELTTIVKIIYCADKLDVRHDGEIPQRERLYKLCCTNIDEGFDEIRKILNEIYKR